MNIYLFLMKSINNRWTMHINYNQSTEIIKNINDEYQYTYI